MSYNAIVQFLLEIQIFTFYTDIRYGLKVKIFLIAHFLMSPRTLCLRKAILLLHMIAKQSERYNQENANVNSTFVSSTHKTVINYKYKYSFI